MGSKIDLSLYLVLYLLGTQKIYLKLKMQSQNPTSPTSPWKIYIDTGGTFTDCIAYDPKGEIHRRKVLSSSAIRGNAEGGSSSEKVNVVLNEHLPDGYFNGCTFSLLEQTGETFKILDYDASASQLILDREIDLSEWILMRLRL